LHGHTVYLRTWNITTLKALHTELHDPVLPACVLGHQNWNNNSILARSVYLVWKIRMKKENLGGKIQTFSLYKGLPSSSNLWGLPTLLFQSRAHKLARTIIPTQLKIFFNKLCINKISLTHKKMSCWHILTACCLYSLCHQYAEIL
jgi:hypothetical protein